MDIPFDVLKIVASFVVKPKMKLLDWIDADWLDWYSLSENSNFCNATDLLEKYFSRINWTTMSCNSNATQLLEKQAENPLNKINWFLLSGNSGAIKLIEKVLQQDPDKINRDELSSNPQLVDCDTYIRSTS